MWWEAAESPTETIQHLQSPQAHVTVFRPVVPVKGSLDTYRGAEHTHNGQTKLTAS